MKFTDKLFNEVKTLWDIASEKEFLFQMAKGTLANDRFKEYMLQDYYYLVEYKDILERLLKVSDDEVKDFIQGTLTAIVEETEMVHLPALKNLGVSDEEIKTRTMAPAIKEYTDFYKDQIEKYGLLAGITALLQCSWNYAYLGKELNERYHDDIVNSPFKMWFDAYVSEGYVATNEKWINLVDTKTSGIDEETEKVLKGIFKSCAEYEIKFWDSL